MFNLHAKNDFEQSLQKSYTLIATLKGRYINLRNE